MMNSNKDITLIIDGKATNIAGNETASVAEKNVNNDHESVGNALYNKMENRNKDDLMHVFGKRIFYGIIIPSIYMVVFIFAYFNTLNIYHLIGWFGSVLSITYVLCVINVLLFSTKLCFHSVEYQLLEGINYNYVPSKIYIDRNKPWNSISQVAHIRGSTLHKLHATLMGYGSFGGIIVAVMKIFDIHTVKSDYNQQQISAVYLFLFAGIGGMIVANIEVYISPSFPNNYNLIFDAVHTVGAFLYAIIGNISFMFYNDMDMFSVFVFAATIVSLIVYKINMECQYKRKLNNANENYDKWVHNISKINIGIEVTGISFSALAMCMLTYQFGNE
eukprot:120650_1